MTSWIFNENNRQYMNVKETKMSSRTVCAETKCTRETFFHLRTYFFLVLFCFRHSCHRSRCDYYLRASRTSRMNFEINTRPNKRTDETKINKKRSDECLFATVGKPEVEAHWINLFFPLHSVAASGCVFDFGWYRNRIRGSCSIHHVGVLGAGVPPPSVEYIWNLLNRQCRFTSTRQRVVIVAYHWTSATHTHTHTPVIYGILMKRAKYRKTAE